MIEERCWMLDAGCWILPGRTGILDIRKEIDRDLWRLDRMLDT